MKKIALILVSIMLSLHVGAKNNVSKQARNNFNFGWDVYHTDDYRWRNIFIGTAYVSPFENTPKAYWSIGGRINWSKYSIYPYGDFGMGGGVAKLKTTSLSIPMHVGYEVFKGGGFGMNLYTGPSVELILKSKLDGYNYYKINNFQTGWTVGSTMQFLYLFKLRVGYSYYPISLFSDRNMPRNAISFSVGF